MVSLIEINEGNYQKVMNLEVSDEQKNFVAAPVSILARAFAKRKANAQALAIVNDETIVGVIMFLEATKEPSCYIIEQFLIGRQYQNMGFGRQALKLIIDILSKERKHGAIEICVKKEAVQAMRLYKGAGFYDTDTTDPDEPNLHYLRYVFV